MTYSEEMRDLLEDWVYPSVIEDLVRELEALFIKELTEATYKAVCYFYEVENQEDKLTTVQPD